MAGSSEVKEGGEQGLRPVRPHDLSAEERREDELEGNEVVERELEVREEE